MQALGSAAHHHMPLSRSSALAAAASSAPVLARGLARPAAPCLQRSSRGRWCLVHQLAECTENGVRLSGHRSMVVQWQLCLGACCT